MDRQHSLDRGRLRRATRVETMHRSGPLADAVIVAGGTLSFNNLLDLDASRRIALDHTTPTVVVAEHSDPVGIAMVDELVEASRPDLETDPVASSGVIVAVNRTLDGPMDREIASNSFEAIIVPGYDGCALGILKGKQGLEILPRSTCLPIHPGSAESNSRRGPGDASYDRSTSFRPADVLRAAVTFPTAREFPV